MESNNSNNDKFKKQTGEWNMKTIIEEAGIKELERHNKFTNGLKVIAVVGIGAGLYGFKLGRRSGIRSGLKEGYLIAGHEFVTALREHHEELKKSIVE